jgi:hypothetical protein
MNRKQKLLAMIALVMAFAGITSAQTTKPPPTSSASPSFDFTPKVTLSDTKTGKYIGTITARTDWRCTIDVAADRITLSDAKTGEYMASGPLSTWVKGTPTLDQLCDASVAFSKTVIDMIATKDNNFTAMNEGGHKYANGNFETIVHVGEFSPRPANH